MLKLNNHTWKKLQNYFFVEKNEPQIIGFVVAKRAPSLLKKILLAYLCKYDLQNSVWNFLK